VSVTTGSVLLLTVVCATSGTPGPSDAVTVTGLGATWTKLGEAVYGTRRRGWLYRGIGGTGSGSITIEYTSVETIQEMGWVLDELTGQESTATEGFASNPNTGTTGTVTSAGSATAGDATYSSLCTENNIDATPEAGWTALGQTTTGSLGVRRIESAWDSDADLSSTWTWDGASQSFVAFIVIVNGAASGDAHTRTITRVVSTHTG
jgi:hypothetical protein